jgi:O-antigen/teichoic acid export membrane protein
VGVVNAVVFQWLNLGARRFLAAYADRHGGFLSTIGVAYLRLAGAVVMVAIIAVIVWPDPRLRGLIGLGAILVCSQAWLDLNLELSLAGLRPIRYGTLILTRAFVGLAAGVVLAYEGLGAYGVVIGTTLGYLTPGAWVAAFEWRAASRRGTDPAVMRDLLSYGLPLTATYALAFVVTSSDRLLLGWLKGSAAVGPYAVAYDTTSQALIALMMMVNLSAFPLAVRALEEHGVERATKQLTQHAVLLFTLALPATVGLALLAPNIAATLFGPSFQVAAAELMPWLAVGALLAGVKAFYFDLSFQLGRVTRKQIWVSGCAAALNLVLNIWWIPGLGALGAAWASLIAFLVGCTLSAVLGRQAFRMPLPVAEWARIAVACSVMALALWPFASYRGQGALVLQVAGGVTVYAIAAALLNVGNSRTLVAGALRNR